MISSIYFDSAFLDAEWGLHHLVRKIVGAVFSGVIDTIRHWAKVIEFIINPRGVQIENIWTSNGAGTSGTCAITPVAATNSYLVCCLTGYAGYTASNVAFNGSNFTNVTGGVLSSALSYIWGLTGHSTSAGNVTFTFSSTVTWRCVVFQLSGVNQSTPTTDAKAVGGTVTSVSLTLATVVYGMVIDCLYSENTATPTQGQTTISGNSQKVGYLTSPEYPSEVVGYSFASGAANYRAIAVNPA